MCSYVVVDLEMCEVPRNKRGKGYNRANETIQIGAVLLGENFEIVDKFMTYVAPEFGVVSTKIEDLTGISRKKLIGAPKMRVALEMFAEWCPEDVHFVAWSENDELQIRHEITEKSIEFAGVDMFRTDNWTDCQLMFSEIVDINRRYKLEEAMNIADIDYDLRFHDGLVDASNTALLFKKIKTEKEFKFNTYYIESKKPYDHLTSSFGELFGAQLAGLHFA